MICANHPSISEGVYRCSRCNTPYCSDCLVTIQGRQYCARCKTEQIGDIRSGVDSTEMQLAGIGRRFAAIWVDGFVLSIPVMILIFAVMIPVMASGAEEPPAYFGVMAWAFIPLYIIYEGLMLQYRGQTLGKMALRIRVVRATGEPISAGQAWGRAVVRAAFVSFLSIINYLPAFFTKEKTCIHDMAAKTRVILNP